MRMCKSILLTIDLRGGGGKVFVNKKGGGKGVKNICE